MAAGRAGSHQGMTGTSQRPLESRGGKAAACVTMTKPESVHTEARPRTPHSPGTGHCSRFRARAPCTRRLPQTANGRLGTCRGSPCPNLSRQGLPSATPGRSWAPPVFCAAGPGQGCQADVPGRDENLVRPMGTVSIPLLLVAGQHGRSPYRRGSVCRFRPCRGPAVPRAHEARCRFRSSAPAPGASGTLSSEPALGRLARRVREAAREGQGTEGRAQPPPRPSRPVQAGPPGGPAGCGAGAFQCRAARLRRDVRTLVRTSTGRTVHGDRRPTTVLQERQDRTAASQPAAPRAKGDEPPVQ